MSGILITPPFILFKDIDGEPLEDGYVWIGQQNLDPQTNPVVVYWDQNLTVPAAQPIRTINGYAANNGTPGNLFTSSNYSIRVMDKKGSLVYSAASNVEQSASTFIFVQAGTNVVERTAQNKMREWLSVYDFATPADALSNAGPIDTIIVPLNGTTTPAASAGKNILWEYVDGGDSDNVLTFNGDRGGLFSDFDCKATKVFIGQFNETQPTISIGSFRDLIFCEVVDTDTTNYTSIGQTVTHAFRAFVQGAHNGSAFLPQYKDLVGCYFAASGNIQWANRGVSAITADAYQYGLGIASNEFAVNNPSAAGGSVAQSTSMAAVQAIVRSRYADEDSTHISRGVYISNHGLRITSGIEIISDTSGGFSSHYKFGINMGGAVVSQSAIYMPFSATGNAGTIIEYDQNDYSFYDRANNRFVWVASGNNTFFVGTSGVGINAAPSAKTQLFIKASTASQSHLQLFPGATPSSPNNGELWFDGTNVKIVVGGVTKTFTLV